MGGGAVLALQIAAVALVEALLVAFIVAAAWARATGAAGRGTTVHEVERALGAATITTYEQANSALKSRTASPVPSTEEKENGGKEEEAPSCAICLSEFAGSNELVRVVPACGHFFDGWLRERRTCPLCRGGLWPLPQCPPMPPKDGGDVVAAVP